MIDKNISRHLYDTIKMLRRNKQQNEVLEFCYEKMTEMSCQSLTKAENKLVVSIINKIQRDGYPKFPAVQDCFFNSIILSLFSNGRISYVEGWYWDIIPTEHGWNKINDKYFDPTVLFNKQKFGSDIKYFGMDIKPEDIVKFGVIDLEGTKPEICSTISSLVKDKLKLKK